MNIKVNNYMNQVSYSKMANSKMPRSSANENAESKERTITNKDTISISIEGQQFAAEKVASDSKMGTAKITSDLDSFRDAVKSMNEPLTVNWNAFVDPYGTFRGAAKVESRLMQLQDPAASKNDKDMERISDEYADSVIDKLIEKKKAMLASGTAKTGSAEYDEYKIAYDAYHSQDGKSLIEMMDSDTKKAYNIYKDIIDGTPISLENEEFLALRNHMMYIAAKGEYLKKAEELYSQPT